MSEIQSYGVGSSGSKRPYFIALIILLLLVNGILFYNNQSLKKERQETVQLLEDEKLELQTQYNDILQELEVYAQESVESDSAMTEMQAMIEQQKSEIQRLLTGSRSSQRELKEARELIESLRFNTQNYKERADQLAFENQELNKKVTSLKGDVQEKTRKISDLEGQKVTLEAEKVRISEEKTVVEEAKKVVEEEKEVLAGQVKRASVLQASNVSMQGVRYKKNGKEVETNNYKKVEKIKVCLDLMSNAVAKAGEKEVILRILNPKGEVLAVQSLGSGILESPEYETPIQFTTSHLVQYDNKQKNICLFWEHNAQLAPGIYTGEVYHEGYKIGQSELELKKGGLF